MRPWGCSYTYSRARRGRSRPSACGGWWAGRKEWRTREKRKKYSSASEPSRPPSGVYPAVRRNPRSSVQECSESKDPPCVLRFYDFLFT
eukprot:1661849-Prymnesium_polylepis.1